MVVLGPHCHVHCIVFNVAAQIIRSCAEKLVCQLVTMSEEVGASAKTGNQSDTKSGTAVTAVTAAPITVDVDQAALRVTLDVIGLAGFGHDFGCLTLPGPMSDPAPRDHLLRVLPRCFTEVRLPARTCLLLPGCCFEK